MKDWALITLLAIGYILIVNPFNVRRFIIKPSVPIPQEIIKRPRVLVCSIGTDDDLIRLSQFDSGAYREVYPDVLVEHFDSAVDFVNHLKAKSYDVIHFLAKFNEQKNVIDLQLNVSDSDVVTAARENGVKWLFSAAENGTPFTHTNLGPLPFHFVFTLERQGVTFTNFLRRLLKSMVEGNSMPVAWNELAPQLSHEPHVDVPACVFSAGRGQALFLP